MEKTILLWSCFTSGSGKKEGDDILRCYNLWKEREVFLKDREIELKLLVPQKRFRRKGIFEVIERLEESSPELLVESPGDWGKRYDDRLMWPRDSFNSFNNFTCVGNSEFQYTNSLLQTMKINANYNISRIGEGGFTAKTDDIAIISDLEIITQDDLEFLQQGGFSVYRVPVLIQPKDEMSECEKKVYGRMRYNGHIDTELNCVKTGDGNLLLVVNNDYYHVFKSEVDNLKKELDAKLHVIEDSKEISAHAVNFLQLPNNDVLTSRNYPILNSFLAKNLGQSKVHPIETFNGEYSPIPGGGGIRCRTNLIPLF